MREWAPRGIVLSGGPASVYDADVPTIEAGLLERYQERSWVFYRLARRSTGVAQFEWRRRSRDGSLHWGFFDEGLPPRPRSRCPR